eukprot:scaffold176422_cov14-Tisochrysis_lutea.AAC.1
MVLLEECCVLSELKQELLSPCTQQLMFNAESVTVPALELLHGKVLQLQMETMIRVQCSVSSCPCPYSIAPAGAAAALLNKDTKEHSTAGSRLPTISLSLPMPPSISEHAAGA